MEHAQLIWLRDIGRRSVKRRIVGVTMRVATIGGQLVERVERCAGSDTC
jgi:hypothetical protein